MWGMGKQTLVAVAPLVAALMVAPAQAKPPQDFVVPTGASGPHDIILGPDGALWFAETTANQLGRVSTAGVISEFPLRSLGDYGLGVDDVVAGSDGGVWFGMDSSSVLGRMDPASGAISYVEPPQQVGGLAAGADGALWFSAIAGPGLYRVSTAGAIDQLTIGGAPVTCEVLASGPGTTLLCAHDNTVLHLALAGGEVRETRLPPAGAGVRIRAMVTAPNGTVYFSRGVFGADANGVSGTLGTLAPGGGVKEWDTPDDHVPLGLVVGPDGQVWHAAFSGSDTYLSRMSPRGTFTSTTVGNRVADSLAFTPDGSLWVLDHAGNTVTRADPDDLFAPTHLVVSRSLRARHGTVALRLRCAQPRSCLGTLTIRHKRTRIARTTYLLDATETRTVRVRLTWKGRALVRRGPLTVRVETAPSTDNVPVVAKLRLR